MKFTFKARTESGEIREGIVDATDNETAVQILQRNSLIPISLVSEAAKDFWRGHGDRHGRDGSVPPEPSPELAGVARASGCRIPDGRCLRRDCLLCISAGLCRSQRHWHCDADQFSPHFVDSRPVRAPARHR